MSQWEGSTNKVYLDAAGLPTIGVGHLLTKSELMSGKINGVKYGEGLSDDEVTKILHSDVHESESCVINSVTCHLTQNRFDCLVSFVFNVGVGAFKNSTLLKVLNRKEYDKVPEQLRRWNRAGGRVVQGLINRRENEVKLWES